MNNDKPTNNRLPPIDEEWEMVTHQDVTDAVSEGAFADKTPMSAMSYNTPDGRVRSTRATTKPSSMSTGLGGVPSVPLRLAHTTGRADIGRLASQEVVTFQEMLSMETIVATGELSPETTAGSFLYVTAVSPQNLQSKQQSRISYVSKLFQQWHGALVFRLYVTKAIFQQTKLLMSYLPGVIPSDAMSYGIDQLIAAQVHVVVNPSNDSEACVEVPFISGQNWISTNGSTGTFVVVTMQPIVVTQASNSTIPWTLCVSSSMRDPLTFRYAIMPPTSLDDPTTSTPANRRYLGQLYATTSSRRNRRVGSFMKLPASSALTVLSADGGEPIAVNYAIPIEFSLIDPAVFAQKIAMLSVSPPFSFVGSAASSRLFIQNYLPQIGVVRGPLQGDALTTSSGFWFTSNLSKTGGVYGVSAYVAPPTNDPEYRFTIQMPSAEVAQRSIGAAVGAVVALISGEEATPTILWFQVRAGPADDQVTLVATDPDGGSNARGIKTGTVWSWCTDCRYTQPEYPSLAAPLDLPKAINETITRARQTGISTHFMIYCAGTALQAQRLQSYLMDTNLNYPPAMVNAMRISFSASQSPRAFARIDDETRGIAMWLFNLFSGDSDSPWAKIARVADYFIEFVMPLVLTYDGVATIAPLDENWSCEFLADSETVSPIVRTNVTQFQDGPIYNSSQQEAVSDQVKALEKKILELKQVI